MILIAISVSAYEDLRGITSVNPEIRERAFSRLWRFKPHTTDMLLEILDKPKAYPRESIQFAIRLLGHYSEKRAILKILEHISDTTYPPHGLVSPTFPDVVIALSKMGKQVIQPTIDRMAHISTDGSERINCIRVLEIVCYDNELGSSYDFIKNETENPKRPKLQRRNLSAALDYFQYNQATGSYAFLPVIPKRK